MMVANHHDKFPIRAMVIASSTGQDYTSAATWMLQASGRAYSSTNAMLDAAL